MKHFSKTSVLYLVAISIICLGLFDISTAFAASTMDSNVGLQNSSGAFQKMLTTMTDGMITVARIVSTIMIALAGCMIAFNVESANKSVWNIILGIGLAINFGTLLTGIFGGYTHVAGGTQSAFSYTFHADAATNAKWYDILSPFAVTYASYTKAGATAIIPVAAKLLIVLTAINASVKISLDLINGDKMKFLTETLLTTGFYMFLILNWYTDSGINLMGSLMDGFEAIGYQAGGAGANVKTDSIISNAVGMFTTAYGEASKAFSVWSPLSSLATIFCLFVMLILLILTGIEIFMVRIEFYTLAMITVPLIPFAAIPQTKFLFERALSAMINLSVKVSVIAFLEALSCKILTDFAAEFAKIAKTDDGLVGNMPVLIQAIMVSLILYFIIKKIPELVQDLLSGQPSLAGGGLVATAKNVSSSAAKAGAAVATGGASVAKAAATGALQGGAAGAGKFKAAGGGRAGAVMGAIGGGMLGAANNVAGSMAKGAAGMMKNSILGSNNNNTGSGKAGSTDGRSGGLGIVNAMRQGSRLGKNFDAGGKGLFSAPSGKNPDGSTAKTPGILSDVKKAAKNAWSHAETKPTQFVDKDGTIKTREDPTGRHTGIKGSLTDIKKDVQSTYESFSGSKKPGPKKH